MSTETEVLQLSPSLVSALRRCGHQHLWLRRHPEHQKPFQESPGSACGKSLHAALAEFHRRGGSRKFGEGDLPSLLGRHWLTTGWSDPEEERLARLRCEAELVTYYRKYGAEEGTLEIERTWSLYRDLGGLRTEWYGRLDWVRRHPAGGIEVVDWKSGGQRLSWEALAEDPVTSMYGRLARSLVTRQHQLPPGPVRFSLLYLDAWEPEKVTVTLTRTMVEVAEADLADLARGLYDQRLEATEGPWCTWGGGCPVKLAGKCPLFPLPELEGDW